MTLREKDKAAKVLAATLVDAGHYTIAKDAHLPYYLERAKHAVLMQPEGHFDHIINTLAGKERFEKLAAQNNANYLFYSENSAQLSHHRGIWLDNPETISTFAIIGSEEEDILKNTFYKDVPEEIAAAIKTLNLENFIDEYTLYAVNAPTNPVEHYKNNPRLRGKNIHPGDIVYHQHLKGIGLFCFVHNVNNDYVTARGAWYSDPQMTIVDAGVQHDHSTSECIVFEKNYAHYNFAAFVLRLPKEHQNHEANKNLLTTLNTEERQILTKYVYHGDDNELFAHYYKNVFNDSERDTFNATIEALSEKEQNPLNNTVLWKQGFREVYVPFMDWYENNPEDFKTYFRESSIKESILEMILSHEFMQRIDLKHEEDISQFLEEEYPQLLSKVGRNI